MTNLDLEEYKIEFLKDSIQDIQETIRATDIKAGFFLIILCLPFSSADKIFPILGEIFPIHILLSLVVTFCISTWLVALILLIYCLVPFINPKNNINFNNITKHPKGFYFGGYYPLNLGFWHSLLPTSVVQDKYNLEEDINILKELTLDDYTIELHFERVKLIYIRNIKIKRLQQSNIALFLAIVLTLVIALSYFFKY